MKMVMESENPNLKWYIVHTYARMEDKVKSNIEQAVEANDLQDKVPEVLVPKKKVVVTDKNGKKKEVEQNLYPGYVLVKMILDEETWYVVRNAPGVTGFVGTANKPTPLTEKEVASIMREIGILPQEPTVKFALKVGDRVLVKGGPFEGFKGEVREVDRSKETVKVMLKMFGRETLVDFKFSEVEKVIR